MTDRYALGEHERLFDSTPEFALGARRSGLSMIPKNGSRFSVKIMLATNNLRGAE